MTCCFHAAVLSKTLEFFFSPRIEVWLMTLCFFFGNSVLTSCNFLYCKWWLFTYSSSSLIEIIGCLRRNFACQHSCIRATSASWILAYLGWEFRNNFWWEFWCSNPCTPAYFTLETVGTLPLASMITCFSLAWENWFSIAKYKIVQT